MSEAAVLLLKAWQAYDLLEDIATELDTDIEDLLSEIAEVKAGTIAIEDLIQSTKDARDASTEAL